MKRILLGLFVFSLMVSGAAVAAELGEPFSDVVSADEGLLDAATNLGEADLDFGHDHAHGRLSMAADRVRDALAKLSERVGTALVNGFDETVGRLKPGALEGHNRAKGAIVFATTTAVSAAVIYALVLAWKKYTTKAKSQEEKEEEAAKVLLCRAAAVTR
jgi:hypothetical protein